jgi:hypothetical protein
MNALEFSSKIEHGTIKIPKMYEDEYENAYARIIVLVEKPDNFLIRKNNMRLAFQKMKNVNMFEQIENPVEWQKQLRNEWE